MATTTEPSSVRPDRPVPIKTRSSGPGIVRFYRSAVGKKWVMAITGVMLIGFVLFHLLGNIKLYLSREEINLYGEALRNIPEHILPRTWLLWGLRLGLIGAFALHIHSAYGLTRINRKARPQGYQSKRDYIAADFASRTMRWTGVIVALYLVFHLMDLTWGTANPEFERGDPYNNLIYSLQRPAIAAVYVLANVALAIHLFHGTWSMFQSMGVNNPRINGLRRPLATTIAAIVLVGNLSFPIAVQLHLVEPVCPGENPTEPCES